MMRSSRCFRRSQSGEDAVQKFVECSTTVGFGHAAEFVRDHMVYGAHRRFNEAPNEEKLTGR